MKKIWPHWYGGGKERPCRLPKRVLETPEGLWASRRTADLTQQSHFTGRKTETPQGLAGPRCALGHCMALPLPSLTQLRVTGAVDVQQQGESRGSPRGRSQALAGWSGGHARGCGDKYLRDCREGSEGLVGARCHSQLGESDEAPGGGRGWLVEVAFRKGHCVTRRPEAGPDQVGEQQSH